MYSPLAISLKFFRYWFNSSNGKGHGIHSPFVFDFVKNVLNDKTRYPEYKMVEQLRKKLISDNTTVPVEDLGAGTGMADESRSVGAITLRSAKSPKYAQLLYRIAKYYQPRFILELGTSLGISTSYLASANKNCIIVTGEGNEAVASLAKKNFKSLGISNIRVVAGNFDNTLPEMAGAAQYIDMAFIDGNHREQPTINYFNQLLNKMSASSIIIFDDIHWSVGMESAWQQIKDHPSVMLTVDLFFMGIVFFRPEFKVKQHFTIRF